MVWELSRCATHNIDKIVSRASSVTPVVAVAVGKRSRSRRVVVVRVYGGHAITSLVKITRVVNAWSRNHRTEHGSACVRAATRVRCALSSRDGHAARIRLAFPQCAVYTVFYIHKALHNG